MGIKKIYASAMVFFIACSGGINGKNPQWNFFYKSADEIIKMLPENPEEASANYALARAHYDKKNFKISLLYYINSAFTSHRDYSVRLFPDPVLRFFKGIHFKSDYYADALYRCADIFFQYREYEYVPKFFGLMRREDSALFRDFALLAVSSHIRLEKFSEAVEILSDLEKRFSADSETLHLVSFKKASIYEKKGDYQKAFSEYMEIIMRESNSWEAASSLSIITGLEENRAVSVMDKERVKIGEAFYHTGRYSESLKHITRLDYRNSPHAGEIEILLIKNNVRLSRLAQAEASAAGFAQTAEKNLLLTGVIADELWNSGLSYLSIPLYRKIFNESPEGGAQRKEALRRICVFSYERNTAESASLLSRYSELYPEDTVSSEFLWFMARDMIRKGLMLQALPFLQKSLETDPLGRYSANCRFWLYKLRLADDSSEACGFLSGLFENNPDSPYLWRLISDRIGNIDISAGENVITAEALIAGICPSVKGGAAAERITNAETGLNSIAADIKNMKLKGPLKRRLLNLNKYFIAGDSESVNREILLYSGLYGSSSEDMADIYTALASMGLEYEQFSLAHDSLVKLLKLKDIKFSIFYSNSTVNEILFPGAFSACVSRASQDYNIADEKIYSVMKAESSFNPNAVSSAGAVGLMQLMPATAGDIAKKLGEVNYDLRDPCTSVLFGTKYLSWLYGYYKGELCAVFAAYNAGPGNVNKWKNNNIRNDIDFFIESIPFNETRLYVLKTLQYYAQYRILFDIRQGGK